MNILKNLYISIGYLLSLDGVVMRCVFADLPEH